MAIACKVFIVMKKDGAATSTTELALQLAQKTVDQREPLRLQLVPKELET
jgi:hypothetical protein